MREYRGRLLVCVHGPFSVADWNEHGRTDRLILSFLLSLHASTHARTQAGGSGPPFHVACRFVADVGRCVLLFVPPPPLSICIYTCVVSFSLSLSSCIFIWAVSQIYINDRLIPHVFPSPHPLQHSFNEWGVEGDYEPAAHQNTRASSTAPATGAASSSSHKKGQPSASSIGGASSSSASGPVPVLDRVGVLFH